MKVHLYGTRGSIPVSHPNFQEFGGNTTCVMVELENGNIGIIDAGTGIRRLGKDIIARGIEQYDNIYLGLTHFHWDHIQGFPFFEPAYDPRRHFTISVIGVHRSDLDVEGIFSTQMKSEYFPVPFDKMGARFSFQQSEEHQFLGAGALVKALPHHHPGIAYSYRVEEYATGRVLVFSTDVEHGGNIDPLFVEFARNADLLIHDGQYTPEELETKRGWGHSSWEEAVEVAERANVKRLCITHHDPDHDDDFLIKMESQCKDRFPNCFLAREGMVIDV